MARNDLASSMGAPLPEALQPGARVGGARYLLRRLLGRRGSTEVWLGWDVKLEHEIALKFLPERLLQDPHFVEQLEEQTRLSAQLAHPAIARVYQFICDYHVAGIVSEYVEGWPLAALKIDRPQKRYRIEEITLWVAQLCAALEYAHHGFCLVHRALKPSNLLLDRRGQLKTTDFGVAHLVRSATGEETAPEFGGGCYLSPQQLHGAEPSLLDDIYSLGATIYELITGAPPLCQATGVGQTSESPSLLMSERLTELGIEERIPGTWDQTIAACLSKTPGARPQCAREVLRELLKPSPQTQSAPRMAVSVGPTPRPEASKAPPPAKSFFGGWHLARNKACAEWRNVAAYFETFSPSELAHRLVAAVQQNPSLVWAVTLGLVALNLAIALWFLLRR